MKTSLCLVCCTWNRRTMTCLSAYSKYRKSENTVTNVIRRYPNKLSDCWTFSVGLGEKQNLKEDMKNSAWGFFCCLLLAPSYEQINSTETVENWARRVGKLLLEDSRLWTWHLISIKVVTGTENKSKQFRCGFPINVSQNLHCFPLITPIQGSASIPAERAGRQGAERPRNAQEVC